MQDDKKNKDKKVLEERKRAFEAKYQQEEEVRFKSRIRAAKLTGRWAAELLGLSGDAADAYGKSLVELGFSDASGEKTEAKLVQDFAKAGKDLSESRLKTEILRLKLEAEEQIMTEILGE